MNAFLQNIRQDLALTKQEVRNKPTVIYMGISSEYKD